METASESSLKLAIQCNEKRGRLYSAFGQPQSRSVRAFTPYFPVRSYSIKEVAPCCGFHWSQDDVDGRGAQLLYRDWLNSGDDRIIERVQQYNREDVLAMAAVDRDVTALNP